MENKGYLCTHSSTCKYGVYVGYKKSVCDYIGMTGKSRFHDGPKGEIIDGKCGYYENKADERTRAGAKDRIEYKSKKRHVL